MHSPGVCGVRLQPSSAGVLAYFTRTLETALRETHAAAPKKIKIKVPDGAATRKMLSEGWTFEPTACDRPCRRSSRLFWPTFQTSGAKLLTGLVWLSHGWTVPWHRLRLQVPCTLIRVRMQIRTAFQTRCLQAKQLREFSAHGAAARRLLAVGEASWCRRSVVLVH